MRKIFGVDWNEAWDSIHMWLSTIAATGSLITYPDGATMILQELETSSAVFDFYDEHKGELSVQPYQVKKAWSSAVFSIASKVHDCLRYMESVLWLDEPSPQPSFMLYRNHIQHLSTPFGNSPTGMTASFISSEGKEPLEIDMRIDYINKIKYGCFVESGMVNGKEILMAYKDFKDSIPIRLQAIIDKIKSKRDSDEMKQLQKANPEGVPLEIRPHNAMGRRKSNK